MIARESLTTEKVYEGFVWVYNKRGKSQFLALGTWDGKVFTVTTTTGKERTVKANYFWDTASRLSAFEPHFVIS